mmetsp:Transcript_9872/g.60139  ORF Transcript_9872/g.60139 Transcript_9872/m.60139 type:complete len:137 (+) Transcript_9872:2924-3334(+)
MRTKQHEPFPCGLSSRRLRVVFERLRIQHHRSVLRLQRFAGPPRVHRTHHPPEPQQRTCAAKSRHRGRTMRRRIGCCVRSGAKMSVSHTTGHDPNLGKWDWLALDTTSSKGDRSCTAVDDKSKAKADGTAAAMELL